MKRGRGILLAGVFTGMAALLFGLWYLGSPTRPEPVYRGKSLTQWLKRLDDGEAFGISSATLPSTTPAQSEAAEAIRAMATEALPLLMQDIHVSPASDTILFKTLNLLNSLLRRLSGPRLSFRLSFGETTEEDRIRWRAAQGLSALGPLAKPALPELKRLLFTNYFHSSIKEAAYAMAAIGPEGIEILTNAVAHGEEWSGMCAIWALGQHPVAGTNAVPFLISATSSASVGTACGAIQVLGLFHMNAEQVIPALTNALSNANLDVRRDAIHALGKFGPEAASAAPLLRVLTNSPGVADVTLEALRKIQPSGPRRPR